MMGLPSDLADDLELNYTFSTGAEVEVCLCSDDPFQGVSVRTEETTRETLTYTCSVYFAR